MPVEPVYIEVLKEAVTMTTFLAGLSTGFIVMLAAVGYSIVTPQDD